MNAPTNLQVINGADGQPAFVVIPYADFLKQHDRDRNLIPNEVVGMVIESDMTPIRAWREYLGMTQAEVAERLEVSQSAFAQFESPDAKPRRPTIKRVAKALGISVEQLDF